MLDAPTDWGYRSLAPLVLALVLVACGSSTRLPPPPAYEPVNSPEPQTPCDRERGRAQAARERLLETNDPASRAKAAEAVFAQAECEHRAFETSKFAAGTQRQFADRIVAARTRYQDAVNLYEEVPQYGVLRWTVGAQSRLGTLHGVFADKLRRAPVPAEITDAQERTSFVGEIEALSATLEQRAAAAHVAALETAAINPALVTNDDAVRAWAHTSCNSLARLDPPARRNLVVCSEWPQIGDD